MQVCIYPAWDEIWQIRLLCTEQSGCLVTQLIQIFPQRLISSQAFWLSSTCTSTIMLA